MLIIIPYTVVFLLTWLISVNMPNNNYGLTDNDHNVIKPLKEGPFLLILGIIFFFSAFRHIEAPAVDEWIYRPRIKYFRGVSIGNALRMQYDSGISFMYWLGAKVFSTDQGSMIISTLFTVPALLVGMRKHCYDFRVGLAMLFLTGYIATEFNGIAQCISTAIFVLFFNFVYEGRFWKYCIVVLICYMFHHASVFLIPLYFFVRTEHGSPKNIILSFFTLLAIIVLYRTLPQYASLVGLEDYSDVVINGHHGVQLISIAVSVCPAILSFFLPRKVKQEDRITNAVSNMVLLHAVIALTSVIDVYIARLELFTSPFIAIFFSRFARYEKKSKTFFVIVGIAYYLVLIYTYRYEYYFFQFS